MGDASRFVVAGAGSIGCFVGGLLAGAGCGVTLLARPRVIADVEAHGLHMTSLDGVDCRVPPSAIRATEDPAVLAQADCVLVAVKSTWAMLDKTSGRLVRVPAEVAAPFMP